MRGRIIQKMKVGIARYDEAAMSAVVGGGFDSDFQEALPVNDGTQEGATSKRYYAEQFFTCQLDRDNWGRTIQTRSGENIQADIVIVLHRPELERMGLIDTNGKPLFRRGDKIVKIQDRRGNTQEIFDDPPGMFIETMDTAGHGLSAFGTSKQNLLYLYCKYDLEGVTE